MIWFVSRHPGAVQWARGRGLRWDRAVAHLEPCAPEAGDDVYGVLPAHLVARLCERGVRYWHFAVDVPEALRGSELTAQQLSQLGAEFVRLQVQEVRK